MQPTVTASKISLFCELLGVHADINSEPPRDVYPTNTLLHAPRSAEMMVYLTDAQAAP
jgi:hypothetical protein